MTKDMKLEHLHSTPFFAGCSRKELSQLALDIDYVDLPAGYQIFEEGHRNTETFIIETGVVEVRVGDDVVTELGAGEMLGEVALLTHEPATATVPSTMLVIPHNRFDSVLEEAPSLGLEIARQLARRLAATDRRLL